MRMKLKGLSAILLGAIFALTAAVAPLSAQPPKPKACCGPSCPPPPSKKAPSCCHISPAQAPTAVTVAPAPLLLIAAAVALGPVLPDQTTAFLISCGSDRSPPQWHRLASSGLSPPSLA